MKPFDNLALAQAFHGHLGPNLVIGIKMGNWAVAALKPQCCFHLRAEVHCPARPPVSCIIDGIQLSTGCTMGKANIDHVVGEGSVKATIVDTSSGKSVTMQVADGFIENAAEWVDQMGEVQASVRTWEADDGHVFAVLE
jgi:formylmethanofuran dehydrogenase subunit E